MRSILVCCLLLALGIAHAANAENWQDAYRLDVSYRDAERAVAAATDELTKLKADPEATSLALARADEQLQEAQARVRQARVEATTKALTALGDVLNGRHKSSAASAKLELSNLQLQAAQVRRQAGMIADQELARIKEDQAQAVVAQATARRELLGAEARAKMYIEKIPEALSSPPVMDPATAILGDHLTLLMAKHKVREAERALALAQGPDTAPLELTARQRDLQSAQDALRDTERTLKEALDSARRRYLVALESKHLAQDTVKLAQSDQQTARKRYQAGAISRIAVQQAESAKLDTELSYEQALVELWLACVALVQATGGGL